MKTKTLWCLVLLMSLNIVVRAQQVHPMDPKNDNSIWNRMKGTLTNESFIKAKQNHSKLNSTITSSWNGVEMQVGAKTEYAYQNDQLVSSEYFLMLDSGWGENWKVEYVYDNGFLSSMTVLNYNSGNGAYVPVDQTLYGYQMIDSETRLISGLYREWQEGSGWVSVDKFDYTYDNGLISGGSEYIWDSTEWIEVERFTASTSNDSTFITFFVFDFENWVESYREIYPTFTLSELYNFYAEFITEIDFGLTYLSLELPDYIYQEKVNDVWENIDGQITVDYFDMFDGKLKMRELQHVIWDQAWTVVYNNEIWYNQKTDPDSATVYVFFEGEKEAAGQEIYTYNNASQLSEVDYLQNIGNGLYLQATTVLNWEVATSNEPKTDISSFRLNPAYPNPFNPSTNITYSIESAGEVKISVYDLLGRHVTTLVNGVEPAGDHRVQFDAGSLSSGLYIVRMETVSSSVSQKITLLK